MLSSQRGVHEPGAKRATELGARFFHGGDLAEILRYAIDRGAAADLCKSHFRAPLEELRFPSGERVWRAVTGLDIGLVTAVIVASLLLACSVHF